MKLIPKFKGQPQRAIIAGQNVGMSLRMTALGEEAVIPESEECPECPECPEVAEFVPQSGTPHSS